MPHLCVPSPLHCAGSALLLSLLFCADATAQTPAEALAGWYAQGRGEGLARPDAVCEDFLQAMGRKPPNLEYVGCTQDDASYIKPMEARYRVAGKDAMEVEAYLRQTFNLPALGYVCCGWSNGAPYSWREGPDSVRYQIGMGVESMPLPREQWAQIPHFSVTVEVLRQSP